MIRKLFFSSSAHPLADARELKRRLAGLPLDNAFDAVDQASSWLQSLQAADDLPLDYFFTVVRQIDDAAQSPLQRLAREYLNSSRSSKYEERRLWEINHDYWRLVGDLYSNCIKRFIAKPRDQASIALSDSLPLTSARLIAARATQLKWRAYRYAPLNTELWAELGRAYLVADALGYAQTPLQLYPERPDSSDVTQHYLLALVMHASSMDCLLPREIELAERLIAHFLPAFVFSADSRLDSVYWVDAASGNPPARLARQPQEVSVSQRYFSPGAAPVALDAMIATVQHGELPNDPGLGLGLDRSRATSPKTLLPVLKHLARYWAAQPPLRLHPRHAVKTRCAVLHGFADCHAALLDGPPSKTDEANANDAAESWLVENVSLGGFAAEVDAVRSDWPKLGALLCVQPDGGRNWVLAVVRRYGRRDDRQAQVGIQSLSRQAASIVLRPHGTSAAMTGFPGICLCESGAPDEVRLVLSANSFNPQQKLEFNREQRRAVLTPIELEESGSDYQIGRYREQLD